MKRVKYMGMFRLVVVTTFSLILIGLHATGLGSRTAYAQAGQGLEISPPILDLNTDPGKEVTLSIKVRNITQGPLVTSGRIDDFVAQGEEGQAKLLLEDNAEPSPYSFKEWANPIASVTIAPQESKTINVTLNVPADAAPGGHYGVVRFTAAPPELEGTGVALSASVGTLVLINVSGDVVTKASLEEFYTAQNGNKKGLFESGPITFVERLKNDGTVHFKPTGTLRITNMFGKEVQVLSINEKGGNVLPASIRRFEQQLDKKFLFGKFKVELNIQYGGENLSATKTFWVIPYRLLAIVLGILILLVVGLRTGLRRYNQYIIRQAGNSGGKGKKK